MNLLLLFLAFLLVMAVAAGVILLKHLHQKEAQLKSVLEQSRPEDAPSTPYEMSAIDQLLYDRCCRYMTEYKPFLVESFSLQDLANALYTNKGYLSKTINHFSGRNFRTYVNRQLLPGDVCHGTVPEQYEFAGHGPVPVVGLPLHYLVLPKFQERDGGAAQPLVLPGSAKIPERQ